MNLYKLTYFIGLNILLSTICFGQKVQEFEGKITYKHFVTAIDSLYNVEDDYEYAGKTSIFFYKEGNYKWVNDNAYVEMEIFSNSERTSCLKFKENDTILKLQSNIENEKIIEFSITKNGENILGKKCDVLIIKAGSNGNLWERRYSFNKDYKINPESFNNYKYNSTDFIYSKTKSLPLKIELIFKDRKVTYIAMKIERIEVPLEIFNFPQNAIFKNGN